MTMNSNFGFFRAAQIIFVILTIMTMIFAVASCEKEEKTDEELIAECIENFVSAYNDGDFDDMMECLDRKTANKMEAMFNVLGGLAGSATGVDLDLRDLFSLGTTLGEGDFMEVTIRSISFRPKEEATVTADMTLRTGIKGDTVYFKMVFEDDEWRIADITDKKGGVGNEIDGGSGSSDDKNDSNASISISKFYSSDRVIFTMGNKEYAGIINSNGEIFYYIEDDHINWTDAGGGAGYADYSKDGARIYDIINKNGKVVASFEKNIDFDEVVGTGDGTILVYKNTSNISKQEYSYGVIDCESGQWVSPLTPTIYLQDYQGGLDYMGDGVFLAYDYSWGSNYYKIYNSKTGNAIELTLYYNTIVPELINGCIYGTGYENYDEDKNFPYFVMGLDGKVEAADPFAAINKNIKISENSNEEYYIIHNLSANTSTVYDDFKIESIVDLEIVDERILFTIQGADGKYYFVLVDASGNACFEPIARDSVTVSGDKIIYRAYGSKNYTMIDLEGNVIISEEQGYTSMSFGDNGLIYTKNSNGENCILDRNGEIIIISLKSK